MNNKTRQIIEGLKIFQNYDPMMAVTDDKIFITIFKILSQEDYDRLLSFDWKIDYLYENTWILFC